MDDFHQQALFGKTSIVVGCNLSSSIANYAA